MSLEIKKIGSLEIESSATQIDPIYRIIQMIGIFLMAVIILLGFLGIFGNGMISKTKINGATIDIEYDRYVRLQSSYAFHITIHSLETTNANHNIQLAISNPLFKKVSIKSISPQPIRQEISNNRIIYTFLVDQIHINSTITFVVEAENFGKLETNIELISPKEEIVSMYQFIYP